jgi:hypothetical protein
MNNKEYLLVFLVARPFFYVLGIENVIRIKTHFVARRERRDGVTPSESAISPLDVEACGARGCCAGPPIEHGLRTVTDIHSFLKETPTTCRGVAIDREVGGDSVTHDVDRPAVGAC